MYMFQRLQLSCHLFWKSHFWEMLVCYPWRMSPDIQKNMTQKVVLILGSFCFYKTFPLSIQWSPEESGVLRLWRAFCCGSNLTRTNFWNFEPELTLLHLHWNILWEVLWQERQRHSKALRCWIEGICTTWWRLSWESCNFFQARWRATFIQSCFV